MRTVGELLAPSAALLLALTSPAAAQVDPTATLTATTVTLPDGPGSVQGLARPAELDLFTGQVQHTIPIRVPTTGGLSPSVALSYSGALGNGPVGMGWMLSVPAIRMSLRDGVPRYDGADELTVEGLASGRLVHVRGDDYVVEGAVRAFQVHRVRDGFEVIDADGTRYRFGHTAEGRIASADSTRTAGWLLQHVANLAGESMDFTYRLDRGQRYLTGITWGHGRRYRVDVELEARRDVTTSFATGFEVTTALRVDRIRTRVAVPGRLPPTGIELARYELVYDSEDLLPVDDGSVSRLVRVTMTGQRDVAGAPLPDSEMPPIRFDYAAPERPAQWPVETDGWIVGRRGVALFDVDGDGADDLLRLEPGYAAWRKNLGGHFAAAQPFDGADALEQDQVRALDLDGDARAEVVRIVDDTWRAYRVEVVAGRHGLSAGRTLEGTRNVPLTGVELVDVDGDGRTDVLDAVTSGLRLRKGTATGLGPDIYLPPVAGASPQVAPGAADVRFLDANSDGLADAVWLADTWMKIYLGRGDGTFVAFAKVFYPWGTAAIAPAQVQLVDLDRDGVLDLLRTDAGKVRWFRGLAGFRFDLLPRQQSRPAGVDLDAELVLSDLSGNGSLDLLWISQTSMTALDLAGGTTRAMLASIDDGMGEVTRITYGTSTQLALAAAAAGQPWQRALPRSMAVPVRQETVYADGTPTRVVLLGVRDGAWDGAERRFAGFLGGSLVYPGDTAADSRVERSQFLEGVGDDRALRGKPREQRAEDGLGAPLTITTRVWEALRPDSLAGAANPTDPLLRIAALRREETAHHQGVTTPIVVATDISYDGEGRPFEEHHHGRLDLTGDERTVRRGYAGDETTGVRDRIVEDELYRGTVRASSALVSHVRHYFGNHQGDPLPLGQVGFGWPRRSDGLLFGAGQPARWVTQSSAVYDAHGNVVASTDGPAGVGATRTFVYDADGLFPERESISPAAGQTLSWTATWDPVLGVVRDLTQPDGNVTHATYDGLGRITAQAQNALPAHVHHVYQWTAPRPRTFTYAFDGEASALPASGDHWQRTDSYRGWRHTVTVADSSGAQLYTAGRLDASRWLISGWKRRDARGRVREVLEGFTHAAADLPVEPPAGVRAQSFGYDALDRLIEHRLPSGAVARTIHRAFEQTLELEGRAPVLSRLDGDGRIVHTERRSGLHLETVDATYDPAGRVLSLALQRPTGATAAPCVPGAAAPGVSHCFLYDSLGRMIEADDPDIGLRQLGYDDAGRLIRHVNGAGQGITLGYDRAGRLVDRRADDGTRFEYHYDAAYDGAARPGQLAWVQEPTGRVDLAYDAFGRNHRTARGIGATRLSHDVVFAASGAVLGHRYVEGWTERTAYDMAGQIVKVVGEHDGVSDTLWEATSFDGAGRLTGERFGNGATGAYAHDDNGQTSHVTVRRTTGLLYDVGLTRDRAGAITDVTDGDGAGLDHTAHYDHDAAGRLTAAILGKAPAAGAADPRYSFSYGYDGLQNMISRQATQPRALGQFLGVHCYGQDGAGPRQLTRIVTGTVTPGAASPCDTAAPRVASFSYDDAGRQITGGGSTMTYNGLDQLVAVDLPGGLRVEHAYGFDGQRIRTSDNRGAVPEHWMTPQMREIGGAIEQYVTVGDRIVARVRLPASASGSRIAARAAGRTVGLALLGTLTLVLSGLGVLSAGRTRSLRPALAMLLVLVLIGPGCSSLFGASSEDALWKPTAVTYFHTGAAAGPALLTGDAARVVDERRYEPFGQAIDSRREPEGQRDGVDHALEPHNGLNKPTDPRTGWSYHGARWMAPETARWLTPDPPVKAPDAAFMQAPWQLHPYQYVDQNPVVYWDADGNKPTRAELNERAHGATTTFAYFNYLNANHQQTLTDWMNGSYPYDVQTTTRATHLKATKEFGAAFEKALQQDAAVVTFIGHIAPNITNPTGLGPSTKKPGMTKEQLQKAIDGSSAKVVILGACSSDKLKLTAPKNGTVVLATYSGTNGTTLDTEWIYASRKFNEAFMSGKTVEESVRIANAAWAHDTSGWDGDVFVIVGGDKTMTINSTPVPPAQ